MLWLIRSTLHVVLIGLLFIKVYLLQFALLTLLIVIIPSHRSFGKSCDAVQAALRNQMELWKTADNCGTGQKCLYTV